MGGITGRSAHIDLTTETVTVRGIEDPVFKKLMGGNGLAVKIMLTDASPGIDPLSPENVLIFSCGPLAGTGVPARGR